MKLFVYGTLMRGMPFPMAAYLEQNARFLCEGRLPGCLYDLGGYPGLVYLPGQEKWVRGHVFELADAQSVFERLDAYEAFYPESPEQSEYLRFSVPVETTEGDIDCQTYIYNRPLEGLPELGFSFWGDWYERHKHRLNPDHFRLD